MMHLMQPITKTDMVSPSGTYQNVSVPFIAMTVDISNEKSWGV